MRRAKATEFFENCMDRTNYGETKAKTAENLDSELREQKKFAPN